MKLKLSAVILCVLLAVFAFAACGTPPSISGAVMTTGVDSNANPMDEVTTYDAGAGQFVVAAKLNDAKKDTYVTFVWKFEQEEIYNYKLDAGSYTNIYATLTNDRAWKAGDYSVEIYINGSKEPSKVVNFTVESATTVKITDAHMTTDVNSLGKPIDTVTSYKPTNSKFTVSAIIRNAPSHTKIKFIWKYDGDVLTSVDLDSGDIADRYFYGYLTNTQTWPTGDYCVEIYVQDRSTPSSVVNFTVN